MTGNSGSGVVVEAEEKRRDTQRNGARNHPHLSGVEREGERTGVDRSGVEREGEGTGVDQRSRERAGGMRKTQKG